MTLAFLHTVLSVQREFDQLAQELVAGEEVFHIVDESLLGVTRRAGTLTPTTRRRVLGHVESAIAAGADAVVVTCSSIGPAVEASRPFVDAPLVRIDEPMADLAVQSGSRVGVLATLATTLEPTAELVARRAAASGRLVNVRPHLCPGAFEALIQGDRDLHDELVRDGLRWLLGDVDVVVLAQASMARITDAIPEDERTVPVLSSPRLGMEHVARLVQSRG